MLLLKLLDRLRPLGLEYIDLDSILLLDPLEQLERLFKVIQRIDEDHPHDLSLPLAALVDLLQHVRRCETRDAERGGLEEGGEVRRGPLEDLLRGGRRERFVGEGDRLLGEGYGGDG